MRHGLRGTNNELTEVGMLEAAKAGEYLVQEFPEGLDVILCPSNDRAFKTATILSRVFAAAGKDVPIVTDDRLDQDNQASYFPEQIMLKLSQEFRSAERIAIVTHAPIIMRMTCYTGWGISLSEDNATPNIISIRGDWNDIYRALNAALKKDWQPNVGYEKQGDHYLLAANDRPTFDAMKGTIFAGLTR